MPHYILFSASCVSFPCLPIPAHVFYQVVLVHHFVNLLQMSGDLISIQEQRLVTKETPVVDQLYELLLVVTVQFLVLSQSDLVVAFHMLPQPCYGYYLVTHAAKGLHTLGGVIAEHS